MSAISPNIQRCEGAKHLSWPGENVLHTTTISFDETSRGLIVVAEQ